MAGNALLTAPHHRRVLAQPPAGGGAGADGNGVPTAAPSALASVDAASLVAELGTGNPLVQALSTSKASLAEAERVREALEAEAQEVAQVREEEG